jgi:hypothetical protein
MLVKISFIMKKRHHLSFFNSQEEKEELDLMRMRNLSHEERMMEMRQCINVAYGMHGFDPSNLPQKHKITFILPPFIPQT